jgi:hypothetical protein
LLAPLPRPVRRLTRRSPRPPSATLALHGQLAQLN